MSGLTFGRWSIEGGALLRWDLSGPKGLVRFEVADALGFTSAAVYLHEYVAPVGGELEECPVCGKCWCNAMSGDIARALRGAWERTGCDDDVIRTNLERWYNEELSTPPVPVSEGSQVSGEEVGPATNGPNLAATGAGAAAVSPVPVAAQSWDPTSPQHAVIRAAIAWRSTLELIGKQHPVDAVMAASDAAAALIQAVDALPHIGEPAAPVAAPLEPRWGSGPLVDHNLETPAGAKPREPVAGSPTAAGAREADPASIGLGAGSADPDGSRYPAKYGYCAQCGAEPGQSCHYMFGDDEHEPNSVRPEPHFYRDSPDDDPNWRNLSAYKAPGTGSADPDGGAR